MRTAPCNRLLRAEVVTFDPRPEVYAVYDGLVGLSSRPVLAEILEALRAERSAFVGLPRLCRRNGPPASSSTSRITSATVSAGGMRWRSFPTVPNFSCSTLPQPSSLLVLSDGCSSNRLRTSERPFWRWLHCKELDVLYIKRVGVSRASPHLTRVSGGIPACAGNTGRDEPRRAGDDRTIPACTGNTDPIRSKNRRRPGVQGFGPGQD